MDAGTFHPPPTPPPPPPGGLGLNLFSTLWQASASVNGNRKSKVSFFFLRETLTYHQTLQSFKRSTTESGLYHVTTYHSMWQILLILKWLSCELLHCALRIVVYPETAMHLGCNELVNCCMARPQSIVVHIGSMANTGTRMSLSHSWYLQWYSKICYFHGVFRSGYATMRNAQRNKSEDNLFELGVCTKTGPPIFLCGDVGFLEPPPPPPPHTHTHTARPRN